MITITIKTCSDSQDVAKLALRKAHRPISLQQKASELLITAKLTLFASIANFTKVSRTIMQGRALPVFCYVPMKTLVTVMMLGPVLNWIYL